MAGRRGMTVVSRTSYSAPRKARPRRRPRLKFFFVLAAFAALAVLAIYIATWKQPLEKAVLSSVPYSAEFNMLVVRDESVYEAQNYAETQFIATEGSSVESGDAILKVFGIGYNEKMLSQLLDIRKDILDHEVGVLRAGIIDTELDEINARIDTKAQEIESAVAENRPKVLLSLQRDMESLLEERMSYLESVVVADETLDEMRQKEQQYEQQIDDISTLVTADRDGIVSFYFDGCEALMTKDKIGEFSIKTLEDVESGKTFSTSGDEQAYSPLYRIVSENNWYVVMLSEKAVPEMFIGNDYSLVFDDYLNYQYFGTVIDIQELENNDGYVYTIQIEDDIGPMLGERRVLTKAASKITGLRVPKSSIRPSGGIDYVETQSGEKIPVLVVAQDGDYVLVQNYKGQPGLEENELVKK